MPNYFPPTLTQQWVLAVHGQPVTLSVNYVGFREDVEVFYKLQVSLHALRSSDFTNPYIFRINILSSIMRACSVVSDSLWPHEL